MIGYYTFCFFSGLVWGSIAFLLGNHIVPGIWAGVIVSPLIGVLVGYVWKIFCPTKVLWLLVYSLVMLYAAASVFGLITGVYDAGTGAPQRIFSAVVIQSVLGTIWGLTFTGFVFVLWPLSYFNFWLAGKLLSRTRGPLLN